MSNDMGLAEAIPKNMFLTMRFQKIDVYVLGWFPSVIKWLPSMKPQIITRIIIFVNLTLFGTIHVIVFIVILTFANGRQINYFHILGTRSKLFWLHVLKVSFVAYIATNYCNLQ